MWAVLLRVGAVSALLYLGLVLVLFLAQRRLLYPSSGRSPWPAEGAIQSAGLAAWPREAPREAPRALVAQGASGAADPARGTVVVFHGNGGNAADRAYYAEALVPLGFAVVLAEYPGYGDRPGSPSEAAYVADARETIRLAHEAFGGPLLVWGESLGAGVAAQAAPEAGVPVAAVVMLTPWDRLGAVAQEAFPFVPARLVLRDRYDSVAGLSAYGGPVAVLVAERDEVIPSARGLALYEALRGPKRLWTFPGAGHNSWPLAPEEAWWREVTDWALAPGGR